METKRKVGILGGQDVYLTGRNGWLIRSKHSPVLRDMSKGEIKDFLAQPIRFLKPYDYELSENVRRVKDVH